MEDVIEGAMRDVALGRVQAPAPGTHFHLGMPKPEPAAVSAEATEALDEEDVEGPLRADGRTATEVRGIQAAVNVLPLVHGSALFSRGETQTMVSATLGPMAAAQELFTAEVRVCECVSL